MVPLHRTQVLFQAEYLTLQGGKHFVQPVDGGGEEDDAVFQAFPVQCPLKLPVDATVPAISIDAPQVDLGSVVWVCEVWNKKEKFHWIKLNIF